jgi:hypothetical protein
VCPLSTEEIQKLVSEKDEIPYDSDSDTCSVIEVDCSAEQSSFATAPSVISSVTSKSDVEPLFLENSDRFNAVLESDKFFGLEEKAIIFPQILGIPNPIFVKSGCSDRVPLDIVLNVKNENDRLVQESVWNEGNGFCQNQQSAWIVDGNATVEVKTDMGIRRPKRIKEFPPKPSKPWIQNFHTPKPSGSDPSGSGSGHVLNKQSQSYLDRICQAGSSKPQNLQKQAPKISNNLGSNAKGKSILQNNKFHPPCQQRVVLQPPQNQHFFQKSNWDNRNRQDRPRKNKNFNRYPDVKKWLTRQSVSPDKPPRKPISNCTCSCSCSSRSSNSRKTSKSNRSSSVNERLYAPFDVQKGKSAKFYYKSNNSIGPKFIWVPKAQV